MDTLFKFVKAIISTKFFKIVAGLLLLLFIAAQLISKQNSSSPTVIREGVIEDGRY
jgi:hypothetical protein